MDSASARAALTVEPAADPAHGPRAGRSTLAGLLVLSLAILTHEILLTRIFSVTLWYHFAFMAISVAMFGGALGSLVVYLRPLYFRPERTTQHLAGSALLFACFTVVCFVAGLRVPTQLVRTASLPWVSLVYLVSAVPFFFGGIAVCLALTRFPGQVGRLYAADLAGAALGCVTLVLALRVTDAPTVVLVVAALGALAAALFARAGASPGLRRATVLAVVVATLAAGGHMVLVKRNTPLLRLLTVKGRAESPALYERWTTFSRIRVLGDPQAVRPAFGWGFGTTYRPGPDVRELDLTIDAASGTVITAFDGDVSRLDYLKHDVTNVAHHLRPGADVLVVGAGGGRDILSALAFDQRSVVGIEINEAILGALNGTFGDYAGHLDRDPRVRFVHDEARSFLARDGAGYDVLQVSLIDTWAATSAGAFALTENSLYTVEAWRVFLDRLRPTGVLTFSRWYRPDQPDEFYRLVALAVAALQEQGVRDARGHLAVVTAPSRDAHARVEVGTLLVSRTPFSEADQQRLLEVAGREGFRARLTPRTDEDPVLARVASASDLEALAAAHPADISPPHDDRPFFFQLVRFSDLWKAGTWSEGGRPRLRAVLVLGVLLATVTGLAVSCFVVPLALTTRKETLRGARPHFVYFTAIGLGFMLVEIAQMQRLSLFLGHPAYSLAVVLFSLLLFAGLGSALAGRLTVGRRGVLTALILALALTGAATPWLARTFQGSPSATRIAVAVLLLGGAGMLMGMVLPLGLRAAQARPELTPWLWGLNGAASVCASVVGVAISMSAGIAATYWTGLAAYAVAAWVSRGTET